MIWKVPKLALVLDEMMVFASKVGLEANSTSYVLASTEVLHLSNGWMFTPDAPLAGAVGAIAVKLLLIVLNVMMEALVPVLAEP